MPPRAPEEKLKIAIDNNNSNEIKQFFKSYPEFSKNRAFSKGAYAKYTPLTYAAKMGKENSVGALLKQGLNPSAVDEHGLSPLAVATTFEYDDPHKKRTTIADIFTILLKSQPDVNFTLPDGATLLCLLAQDGYAEAIDILLQHAPHLLNKTRFDTKYPLLLATEFKNFDAVRTLVKYKADPNLRILKRQNALMAAVIVNASKELVKELLEGENQPEIDAVDTDGATALMVACDNSRPDLVKLLLDKGAKTELLAFNNQMAAITYAVKTKKLLMVALLRNQPLANGLCQHPAFLLCATDLDNKDIFEEVIKELFNQGYVFNDDRFKESYKTTISPDALWKYEMLEKYGATLSKSTYSNGNMGIHISTHATTAFAETAAINKISPEKAVVNRFIKEYVERKEIFLHKRSNQEMLEALIAIMQSVPQHLDENLAEGLFLSNAFDEVVRNHFIILMEEDTAKDIALEYNYFQGSSAFFAMGAYVPNLLNHTIFVDAAKIFYSKASLFFLSNNKSTEFAENLQIYFDYASLGEQDLNIFSTVVKNIEIFRLESIFLAEVKDMLFDFLQRLQVSEGENSLLQRRKLDFTLCYLNFLKTYPGEITDEYLEVINAARQLLDRLGKKYSKHHDHTQQLNILEFKCIYDLAVKTKDPETIQEAQQLLKNENLLSVKERQQYTNKLNELISVEKSPSPKLPEARKIKTKPRSAPQPLQQTKKEVDKPAEDINAKLVRLMEEEKRLESQRKQEADHYLQLRKEVAEQRRNEKKDTSSRVVPLLPPQPTLKWTEAEVRQFYAGLIKPDYVVVMLDHPGGGDPGMYWACLTVDPKMFANPNEYNLYLGKFKEGRVREEGKDSGIVHVNDHYYLRVHTRLPRVHAKEFNIENGPTFLQFGDYTSHLEHVKIMKHPPPPAQYSSEKIT